MMLPSADQNEIAVDNLAQIIQDYIEQAISDDWLEAMLVAEIEDDDSGLTYGRYKTEASANQWFCFDTDYTMYIIFDTLRQHFRNLVGNSWIKAEAKLPRGGSITFSFEYPKQDINPII